MRPLHTALGALVALAVALGVAGSLSAPASAGRPLHGRQTGPTADRLTWSRAGSYVLGDSIASLASDELRARRPQWTVNAVHGRSVAALPDLVRNLRAVDERPYRVVVELGSNQSPRWTKQDYVAALAALPRSTMVLLVTPYKGSGGPWGARGVQAATRYARWMEQIAAQRPRTCTVPWRREAQAHPEWLRDRLHPKPDYYATWVDILLDADAACR
jgi:hypothetical protein